MSLIETKTKLQGGTAVIGIVGMGYVGVPLALSYTAKEIKGSGLSTLVLSESQIFKTVNRRSSTSRCKLFKKHGKSRFWT